MPYVIPADRKHLAPYMEPILTEIADNPNLDVGHLNYMVTQILGAYLRAKGMRYATVNAAIGVLDCAKLELYRRIAGPYEDTKITTNGDVYPREILAEPKT